MATMQNLADAFAGESQANRKYLAFAEQADKDGYAQVARLFRAAASAETIHAMAHLRAMGGVQDTRENLKAAAEGERYEYQEMYPPFLSEAESDGDKAAIRTFKHALGAEEVHCNLYQTALAAVEAGNDLENVTVYLCPICGNIELGSLPANCAVCGAKGEKFVEVN